MTAAQFYKLILAPAAMTMSSIQVTLDSPKARCMLLAIAGQESGWTDRVQVPGGEARGFWQCEQTGALAGVSFGAQFPTLVKVCGLYSIPTSLTSMFEALAWNDQLAYAVARLALWMDPQALPAIGDIDSAWETYLRVWRPGKPSRERWNSIYPQAVAVLHP